MNQGLVKTHAETISVTDLKLASSLMALGVPPVPGEEVSMTTGDINRISFNFLPQGDMSGPNAMTADQIISAWNQERSATCREEEWSHQNPEHPLSYMMCVWDNYLCVRDYVKRTKPKVLLRKGNSYGLIDQERCPPNLREFILGQLGG